ncbi:DUF2897 family protein [Pseudoalteromonas sp. S558]|nr:DUF2897 family protein [Pseudoalteromonas sp. S558]TMO02228.1 DUF2897 domain-containing protein [Pseudoalteromonas sp. S558]
MQTWQIFIIVAGVFAVVIGNIALVKYSAKMEFKKPDADIKNTTDTKKP